MKTNQPTKQANKKTQLKLKDICETQICKESGFYYHKITWLLGQIYI